MRRFLIKIMVFLVPLILYFALNATLNYYLISNQKIDLGEPQVLIIGDSHPQRSINPKLFKRAQNIAQTAEPYISTYWKLKTIIKAHKPDTILLGFAPHNISEFNDMKFSDEFWAGEMFRRIYPIAKFSEIKNKIPVNKKLYFQTLWKQTAFYPKKEHLNYIGMYSNNTTSNLSDYKNVINRHYFLNNKQLGISSISINYLDSIVNICQKKNIKLVLFSSPVHANYFQNIPTPIIKKYELLKKNLIDEVIIYDQTNNLTYHDSLFLNSDHLNQYGANKFTNELVVFLKRKQTN